MDKLVQLILSACPRPVIMEFATLVIIRELQEHSVFAINSLAPKILIV